MDGGGGGEGKMWEYHAMKETPILKLLPET